MKKAMILPLLLGMVWVCSASQPVFAIPIPELSEQQAISEDFLTQIFEEAVPMYASQYGVEVSVYALRSGYDNGSVTVEDIGGNQYRVIHGGNPVIVELDDFF